MQISLSDFESQIDPKILKQGMAVFRSGKVLDCFESSSDEYEAVVQDLEPMSLTLHVKNRVLHGASCTCGVEEGELCCHAVGALFFLMQDELGIKPRKPAAVKAFNPLKEKTDLVDEVLNKLNPQELRGFISGLIANDKAVRSQFLNHFAQYHNAESIKTYCEFLKPLLHSSRNAKGVVLKSKVEPVLKALQGLIDKAQASEAQGNFATCFYIHAALFNEFERFLRNTRDDERFFTAFKSVAVEQMRLLSQKTLPEKLRKIVFKYASDKVLKDKTDYWGFEKFFVEIAVNQAVEISDLEIVDLLFEKKNSFWDDQQYLAKIYYYHVLKVYGEASAQNILKANQKNMAFNSLAIHLKLEEDKIEEAKALIDYGKQTFIVRGLVPQYLVEMDLEIAVREKNHQVAFALNIILRLNSSLSEALKYYRDWKSEWEDDGELELRDLILNQLYEGPDMYRRLYRHICIEDELWPELLRGLQKEVVQSDLSIYELETYEQYLLPEYASEFAHMYADKIKSITRLDSYNNYSAVDSVRRIIAIGELEIAYELIDYLKAKYPEQTNLHSILNQIKEKYKYRLF